MGLHEIVPGNGELISDCVPLPLLCWWSAEKLEKSANHFINVPPSLSLLAIATLLPQGSIWAAAHHLA